jgi:hypothetical protein
MFPDRGTTDSYKNEKIARRHVVTCWRHGQILEEILFHKMLTHSSMIDVFLKTERRPGESGPFRAGTILLGLAPTPYLIAQHMRINIVNKHISKYSILLLTFLRNEM